jgi:hypothetical protein
MELVVEQCVELFQELFHALEPQSLDEIVGLTRSTGLTCYRDGTRRIMR